MLRMSIHGVRMFTEPVFYRGRHGQESEEGKEDREGGHQEGRKEDFKEKEVVASTTERLRLRVATRTQSETSPKDLKCPLQPFGIAARHYKSGPLCSWLLHKGPVFRFRPGEGPLTSPSFDAAFHGPVDLGARENPELGNEYDPCPRHTGRQRPARCQRRASAGELKHH